MPSRPYVSVSLAHGEDVRRRLLDLGLIDIRYKIVASDDALYIPLTDEVTEELLDAKLTAEFSFGERVFTPAAEGPKTLTEALQDEIPPELLDLVPRAYDLVGKIAVLEIPEALQKYSKVIGRAFHSIHENFETVLSKQGAISGQTRVREYVLLWGEDTTKTVHTEYGCRLAVDLSKAYFSPRLLEEHNRVASLVQEGEAVLDMFCGVGPFAIHIARRVRAKVLAIDINPHAIELLRESLSLNRLVGIVEPVVADASQYVAAMEGSVDRVIMNHPSGAQAFVKDACGVLRPGGVLHYYDFVGGEDPEGEARGNVARLVEEAGRACKDITLVRRVRDSAPYEYQVVADAVIE